MSLDKPTLIPVPFHGDTITCIETPEGEFVAIRPICDRLQTDERLHSGLIAEELRRFGIDRPREWIHGELDWLAEMGAVTLLKPGSVVVATLTEKGHRHLRRAIVIEGVKRPSRPGE